MRLINVKTYKLEEFHDETPLYAILSYTWGDDSEELSYHDVQGGRFDKPGVSSSKLRACCQKAKDDDLEYLWVDTFCIDKTNLVELSEAINSMFRWYSLATICYAYLSDVPTNDAPESPDSKFRRSRWFLRGWTLQELIAPRMLRFYGSEWQELGTKSRMSAILEDITSIPRRFLLDPTMVLSASVGQRMSWAARRATKRAEDRAYSLLGIFDVAMPMIYGEGGDKSFYRLQEEIMKRTTDHSILAWEIFPHTTNPYTFAKDISLLSSPGSILAPSPSFFECSGKIVPRRQANEFLDPLEMVGGTLRVRLSLLFVKGVDVGIGILSCGPIDEVKSAVAIPLSRVLGGTPEEYYRPAVSGTVVLHAAGRRRLVYLDSNLNRIERLLVTPNQHLWYYNARELAGLQLEVVGVSPRRCWFDSDEAFTSAITPADTPIGQIQTLVRLRHASAASPDFVFGLASRTRDRGVEAQVCVFVCSKTTLLSELAQNPDNALRAANGKVMASNGLLHLRAAWHTMSWRPGHTIRLWSLDAPPKVTFDATSELQALALKHVLTLVLREEGRGNTAESDEIRAALHVLEQKKQASKGEWHGTSIRETSTWEYSSGRWIHLWKWWTTLWQSERCAGRQLVQPTPFHWAVANDYADLVALFLTGDVGLAARSEGGTAPICLAAAMGSSSVIRRLLKIDIVDANVKDGKGQTPLVCALANGFPKVAKLLLESGKRAFTRPTMTDERH
ncbi:heterokaryon incompatibility protein-domain-containing protein [Xylariaceae sp. FL0594]|nr:heterokaryon incompatibility protein-domain-containing protein [Xylariaceae sp. FL0594]